MHLSTHSSMHLWTVGDVCRYLDEWAPPSLAESYDNVGLLVGESHQPVGGVLINLDCTEAVVEEAIAWHCNLIVCHHPAIFKGLKRLTGSNATERVVMKALRAGIALYACHTNLDNILTGVNHLIADKLGLTQRRILAPKSGLLKKLTFFVPAENAEEVRMALHQAGAGNIGGYSHCSFTAEGEGRFLPGESAQPHIGQRGELEVVQEKRIELIFPAHAQKAVLAALWQAHPYEEVAYYLHTLDNVWQEVGSGLVGELPNPMPETDFLRLLKERLGAQVVRHTQLLGQPIHRVALCGGSGSFLLGDAKRSGAQMYVSADFKYHEFFDAEGQIVIADIGHWETEHHTNEWFYQVISEKFPSIAVLKSDLRTNPIHYF